MHNKVVYRLARGLRRAGRGGAALQLPRRRDAARASTATWRAKSKTRAPRSAGCGRAIPALPYALAGFSFGSRVVTRLGCELPSGDGARFLLAAGSPTRWGSPIPGRLRRCPRFSSRARTISTARAPSSKPMYAGDSREPKAAPLDRSRRPLLRGRPGGAGGDRGQRRALSAIVDPESSMDIITGNVGWIEVICGPMFSGKSEELIRRLRRAMIARKRVEVFKPAIDDRYSRRRDRLARRFAHDQRGGQGGRGDHGPDRLAQRSDRDRRRQLHGCRVWWTWRSGWPTAASR